MRTPRGREVSPAPFSSLTVSRISRAAITSFSMVSERETRTVSPIPSPNRATSAAAFRTTPAIRGPASVTPTWRGTSLRSAKILFAFIVSATEEAFIETITLLKPNSLKTAISRSAANTRASALSRAPESTRCGRLPAFTPMRIATPFSAALSSTALTFSLPPILPGFMRIFAIGKSMQRRAIL